MRSPSLYLIGPRGTGKSSAGELAARRLGVAFVDTDRELERLEGRSVAAIFAEQGEAPFRILEQRLMQRLLRDGSRLLVATGGGCVLHPEVRDALERAPGVLWLAARLDVLQQRIQGSDRPSLSGADPLEELETILGEREPLYRGCSGGHRVDTSGLSLDEVAQIIASHWRMLDGGG